MGGDGVDVVDEPGRGVDGGAVDGGACVVVGRSGGRVSSVVVGTVGGDAIVDDDGGGSTATARGEAVPSCPVAAFTEKAPTRKVRQVTAALNPRERLTRRGRRSEQVIFLLRKRSQAGQRAYGVVRPKNVIYGLAPKKGAGRPFALSRDQPAQLTSAV